MLDVKAGVRKPLEERLSEEACSIIGQAIGEASVCWTEPENAGIFNIEEARLLTFELGHYVADLIDKAKEEAEDELAGYISSVGEPLKRPVLLLSIAENMEAGEPK